MGGRKRKKVIRRMKKSIPKIFACPSCGEKTLGIDIDREAGTATIKCGRCNIEEVIIISAVEQAIDAYGKYIDRYYGQEKSVSNDEKSGDLPKRTDQ